MRKVPQHKQFRKALKVNEKSRIRNHAAKSRIANAIKKIKTAKTQEEAQELFRSAASIIDSTAGKGIIKKQTAARKKSRLSSNISRMT